MQKLNLIKLKIVDFLTELKIIRNIRITEFFYITFQTNNTNKIYT